MSKSLQEIANTQNELMNKIYEAQGELTPEIEAALTVSENDISEKLESIDYVLDKMKLEMEYFKEQAAKYSATAKSISNASDRLKENVKFCMDKMKLKKISSGKVSFNLSDGKFSVDVIDESKIPNKYFNIEQIKKLDKKRLLDDMQSGEFVPGAKIEQVLMLRRTVNKESK